MTASTPDVPGQARQKSKGCGPWARMIAVGILAALGSGYGATAFGAAPGALTINVMAPLLVGGGIAPGGAGAKAKDWDAFDAQLKEMKAQGVDAVSSDVWWGIVEQTRHVFDWRYYDALTAHLQTAGIRWVPILSFHRCGGNVGDDCDIPLPAWVFGTHPDPDALKFKSEQGHVSSEAVSVWATSFVIGDYAELMTAFQRHFAPQAAQIAEINISLGPSGELRYPSYGAHDVGSGYPTRGALQAYSTLARASFRAFLTAKYGGVGAVAKAWGVAADQASELMAPPADPAGFFARREQIETQRGRDFFDWYADSLLAHGRRVMTKAQQIFGAPGAPLRGVDLGAKIPGIHWRLGHYAGGKLVLDDRLAELAAGLIRTSGHDWGSDATGHGYGPLLRMFAALPRRGSGLTVHFTCLEMADGQDKPAAQSLPQSLVRWVGAEAVRQGLRVKGENALGWNIPNKDSWERMRAALSLPGQTGWYQGLTLLRMSDIVASPVAMAELRKTTAAAHAASAMR